MNRAVLFADRWSLTAPMLAEVLWVTPATAYRWMHGGRVCPTAVFCMDLIDLVAERNPVAASTIVWDVKRVVVLDKARRRVARHEAKERERLKERLYRGEV